MWQTHSAWLLLLYVFVYTCDCVLSDMWYAVVCLFGFLDDLKMIWLPIIVTFKTRRVHNFFSPVSLFLLQATQRFSMSHFLCSCAFLLQLYTNAQQWWHLLKIIHVFCVCAFVCRKTENQKSKHETKNWWNIHLMLKLSLIRILFFVIVLMSHILRVFRFWFCVSFVRFTLLTTKTQPFPTVESHQFFFLSAFCFTIVGLLFALFSFFYIYFVRLFCPFAEDNGTKTEDITTRRKLSDTRLWWLIRTYVVPESFTYDEEKVIFFGGAYQFCC